MNAQPVLSQVDARGVATVTLNRPEVNNAYDETLIQGLHDAMDALGAGLRVLVRRHLDRTYSVWWGPRRLGRYSAIGRALTPAA